eukprot:gene9101-6394_t
MTQPYSPPPNSTQTRTHLEFAYVRDLPVGLTLYGEPQLLGRRPITYKGIFNYLYEQQLFREVQGSPPLEYRDMDNDMQDELHGKLRSWLRMAAGKDRPLNVDTRIQSKEKSDGISAQPKRNPEEEDIFEAQERLFTYFFYKQSPEDKTKAFQMPHFFYGMRQIPSHSPEYLATIYDWAVYFSCVADSNFKIPLKSTSLHHNVPQALSIDVMPEFIKNILKMGKVKLNFPEKNAFDDDEPGTEPEPIAISVPQEDCIVGATCEVEKFSYNPVVLAKVSGVMDALVPPRLLVFFDIDDKLAERQFRNREKRQRKIETLIKENAAHPGNKRLLRELQEEKELQRLEDPVVGEAMLLMERASMSQSTRMDLLALEKEVERHLTESCSRCWGLPLKMNPQSSNFAGEGDGSAQNRQSKSKNGQETDTVVMRQEPQTGLNNVPVGVNFYNTICPGTKPTALSKEYGGTATVSKTLNIVELNHERTDIHLHLLGAELLRQIILDLPERGVLLSRVLNEAVLSMRVYEVLLKESSLDSGDTLLIGQKDRALAAKEISKLEEEIEELKAKRTALQQKKKSLKAVFEHRKTLELVKAQQERNFQEALLERLRTHAEETKEAQDRERRGSETAE